MNQDPNVLTDIVAYHVVFGHFQNVTDYPNTTIGRTALGDPSVVMLEGNKNQVVAWARRSDDQVHVLNQKYVQFKVFLSLLDSTSCEQSNRRSPYPATNQL